MEKIVMLYNGSDNTNKVASSTKEFLKTNSVLKNYYSLEIVNLDKTNIIKYLEKTSNIDILYIPASKEIFIANKNTTVKYYDWRDCIFSEVYGYGTYPKKTYNGLGWELFEKIKEEQGKVIMWTISGFKVYKTQMYKLDYEAKSNSSKSDYFKTEAQAIERLGETLRKRISDNTKNISKLKDDNIRYSEILKDLYDKESE